MLLESQDGQHGFVTAFDVRPEIQNDEWPDYHESEFLFWLDERLHQPLQGEIQETTHSAA